MSDPNSGGLEKSKFGSIASSSTSSYRTNSIRTTNSRLPARTAKPPSSLEWLFDVDLLFKEEAVTALEGELLKIGITEETFRDARARQNSRDIKNLAAEFVKSCRIGDHETCAETAKQLKLIEVLDQRLGQYHQALSRTRELYGSADRDCAGGPAHDKTFRVSKSTVGRSASTASKAYSKISDATTAVSANPRKAMLYTLPSATAPPPKQFDSGMDGSRREPPTPLFLATCAALTVVFIIGGMVGLYFERESPKRVGLIAVLVILLVVFLAFKRTRPVDIFILAAAYAAVLVVFLSGDLGGPQEVVVVDIASGANLQAASTTTVMPVQATTVSSGSGPPTTPVDGTGAPEGQSTFTTIVVPTTAPDTTQATPIQSLVTPTPQTPTTGFVQDTGIPVATSHPNDSGGNWTPARIAGVVVGCLMGVVLTVVGGVLLQRYRHSLAGGAVIV